MPLDVEYDFAKTLGGMKGIWHRLWAALSLDASSMFGDSEEVRAESAETICAIRAELEGMLSREMTDKEFDTLKLDAS